MNRSPTRYPAEPSSPLNALTDLLDPRESARDALVVDPEVGAELPPDRGERRPGDGAPRSAHVREERAEEEVAVRDHVADREDARLRAELLVEVVLELKRPLPLVGVLRVERRVGL